MLKRSALPAPIRRQLAHASDAVQLAVLRRVIWVNRLIGRGRRRLEPYGYWLWLPPFTLAVGFLGGFLTNLR